MARLRAGHADGAPHGAAQDAGALAQQGVSAPAVAHGGHGAAAAAAGPQQFLRESAAFSERWRLPDGRVHPRPLGPTRPAPSGAHAGHDAGSPSMAAGNDDAPIDVLMAAGKWFYLPNALKLDVGRRYRFRMMALDVGHGASIQFGRGGRMMRLQPGRIAETEMQFARPGRFLVYCTVYCGPAHDVMQASIEVA
jgi:heme/copper-type cytochrome/quinol oxidase subunit 2